MNAWPTPSRMSAAEIAALLGLPEPTDEQRAVIEAPPVPALVVAGAGSGKTETMAGRVVWLVANGHVRREEILGLTFTRKAAGELAERIARRLELIDERLGTEGEQLLLRPRVSTYNAFADALMREHAARIGREPDAVLQSEAAAWLLARQIVLRSRDPELAARDLSPATLPAKVLGLAGAALDHRADLDEVAAFGSDFAAELARCIETERKSTGRNPGKPENAWQSASDLRIVVRLAQQYARAKAERGVFDYADQVAGAIAVIEASPDVAAELRQQYRVVLLDEYQDTSVIQTQLLSGLFAEQAVMAVGDPNQAIYGWRGASADNLAAFPDVFSPSGAAERFDLSISWRNDRCILDAANALLAASEEKPRIPVPLLRPRPQAGPGRVRRVYPETIEDEAAAVADWFAEVRAKHAASAVHRDEHTGAILFRTKKHMPRFAAALAERGIPHRILGLGGLLQAPEVVDVVSALRVIDDPSAGSALIRLLAGPRFAIGVADLAALHELALELSRRDESLNLLDAELRARIRGSAVPDESVSIIEALDFLRTTGPDYRLLSGFTDAAKPRLREAAEMFARLRQGARASIPELLRQIESELRLDIELAANEVRGRGAHSRLRAFGREVQGFLAAAERESIGALLSWLDHAEQTDELRPRPEPPEPGVVQLLTIHGAKGLEWDATAVVRWVKDELPGTPKSVQGWLSLGELPYRFRGDRGALPELRWDRTEEVTRKVVDQAIGAFNDAERAYHEAEERRLAYVAVTRSRSELLLSGSWWSTPTRPREPSAYLQTVIAALGLPEIAPSQHESNPRDAEGHTLVWPLDPLGSRRLAVEAAAALVSAVGDATPTAELSLLLAEREARRLGRAPQVPTRIPASRFKDFVGDFSGTVRALARPMPERPFPQTALGTLFHIWVEQHYGTAGAASLDDALWEGDDDERVDAVASADDRAELARLQEVFLASGWAGRAPIAVETEINFPLSDPHDGSEHIVICKLDAVFAREGGGVEIVDWKTGRAPANETEREERMLQLALYRLAYHRRHSVPLEQIDVALYYVAHDLVLREESSYSEAELLQRWSAARAAR